MKIQDGCLVTRGPTFKPRSRCETPKAMRDVFKALKAALSLSSKKKNKAIEEKIRSTSATAYVFPLARVPQHPRRDPNSRRRDTQELPCATSSTR